MMSAKIVSSNSIFFSILSSQLEEHLLHKCKFEECHVCQQKVTQQPLSCVHVSMTLISPILAEANIKRNIIT